MRKAENPGPDSLVDGPQDVEVTGDLLMSLTAFVGRERELDEVRSLFREGKRLVTLVGIGGIGKTRLALELGFSARDLGWSKVYLVELASLANPDLVDGAVLELWSSRASCWLVAGEMWQNTILGMAGGERRVHPGRAMLVLATPKQAGPTSRMPWRRQMRL